MKTLKKIAALFGLTALLLLPLGATTSADVVFDKACADAKAQTSELCQNVGQTGDQTATANSLYGPDGIITRIVKIFGQVIGFVAVLMIIIGGLKYIISQGDSNNVNAAKNTILYAVIGVVVAVMSQAIVVFVLNKIA